MNVDYKTRAKDLLAKMTVKEKIGQIAQGFYGFKAYTRNENGEIILTEEFKNYVLEYGGLGMLNNYFRADPWTKVSYESGGITLNEREHAYNVLQKFMVEETRLGIPVLIEEDSPHGRVVLDSIIYPVSLNIGCSFNTEICEKQAEMIGTEAKLGGVNLPYLSILDMATEPRWGRTEEAFSEDPYLSAKMSEASVAGINNSGNMFCAKHFIGQGAVQGGHNQFPAPIGERELREIHLPSTKAAVDAGCDFIMAAYNEVDGVLCHANGYMNNTVLREELGFDGVLRSDANAVEYLDMLYHDKAYAASVGLKAGIDADLWDGIYVHLEEAIEKGYIEEADLDRAVLRLLEKKFKCGIMDNPYLEENNQSAKFVNSGLGQKIAYDAASESLVMLKNENKVLPLKKGIKLLVMGETFEDVFYQLGDYSSERINPTSISKQFTDNGAKYMKGWSFEEGIVVSDSELDTAMEEADAVIYAFGGSSARSMENEFDGAGTLIKAVTFQDCGEGCDSANIELTAGQKELIKKIRKYNKPIISLGIGGRAYIISEICKNSDAVIWCGYPGEEGAKAIYDTLFGDLNNFGRLSFSIPRSVGQLPITYNQKRVWDYIDEKGTPEYAFGYGLSYSTFEYKDLTVEACSLNEISNGKSIKVECSVKNISDIKGKAVPQMYIYKPGGTITPRLKELKGFEKIELLPGEEKRVQFLLNKEALEEWSVNKKYELYSTDLKIMIGDASNNIILEEIVHIA